MNETSKQKTIRNILVFTILVNGLAWLGPVLGGSPAEPGPGFLVWGTAPIVAALIMKLVLGDKVSWGMRPHVRGNGRYYLFSLLAYPVTIAGVLAAGLLLGLTQWTPVPVADGLTAVTPLIVIYFIFAIFEEFGWRGYLSPKVYSLNDSLWGHVVVGVIWASWHFPYLAELWSHTSESLWTLLPRFVLGTIIFTVVYGEIRLRTRSVWPAVLMHWSGNTVANGLLTTAVALTPGQEWLGSFGVEGVMIMVVFALVGGVLYVRRRQNGAETAVAAA